MTIEWPDVPKQAQEFACTKTGLCDCASEGDHDARTAARVVQASLPPGATVWDCPTCGQDPEDCYCSDDDCPICGRDPKNCYCSDALLAMRERDE